MHHEQTPTGDEEGRAEERRLQVGAALVLGLLVLVAVVLRAGLHNVFPAGWWKLW